MTKTSQRSRWAVLLLLALVALAVVMVPVLLIQPFQPQTPSSIALAFALRRWSPLLTAVVVVGALFLSIRIWRTTPRFFPRAGVAVLGLLFVAAAWMARQNHFEWMFAPLPDARFIRAAQATTVSPSDMVLAVTVKGDAAAYPVRQLAYHHVVLDAVGGVPIVATY